MSKDNLTKRQLIIIDDDKPTTNYNVKLAEQTDCFTDVVSFNSAETAIDFLTEQEKSNNLFDGTIIVDVYMEEIDGLEFLDEIDEQELVNPATEILVLTGKNSVRSREKTEVSALKTSFALKPLTEEILIALANRHA